MRQELVDYWTLEIDESISRSRNQHRRCGAVIEFTEAVALSSAAGRPVELPLEAGHSTLAGIRARRASVRYNHGQA